MKDEKTVIIEHFVLNVRKKLNAIKYLNEEKVNENNKTANEIFNNLLFLLERLLWESLVTNICLLFERNWYEKDGKRVEKKTTRSLYWYIDEKRKLLPDKNAEYDSLVKEFDECIDELKKIRKIRDKLIAHRDKESDDEIKFLTEINLNIKEVEKLTAIAEKVVCVDIEKIDATFGFGINKLFDLVKILEKESPGFGHIVAKYGFNNFLK